MEKGLQNKDNEATVKLDEIKDTKQKINLEAQKCLLQCPLSIIVHEKNLCSGLTFENICVSNMRHSESDN